MMVIDEDAAMFSGYGDGSSDQFSQQRWQDKTAAVADDYIKLKYQLETAMRDKERDANTISSLKHEVGGIAGRMAAAALEHRETRNHWLSEKSELESRTFQMLALQTQIQGTMRKKEKDYEKLQGQLDKVVRDSMRGNKAVIVVSKPLQKNSSQVKAAGTLLDAELIAAKSIISLLQHENEELRQAVEGLAQSVQILQEENILNEAQRERDYNNREHEEHFTTAPNTPSVADPLSDERKSRDLDEQMVALEFDGACRDAAPITPIALLNCLNDANIEGASSARPVRWIVDQVCTEVRRLRERAERSQVYTNTPNKRNGYSEEDLIIKNKLAEAFLVIQEQDRLIHHALFGRIAGLYGPMDLAGNRRDSLSTESEDNSYPFSPVLTNLGNVDDIFADFDSDFLPPASPATMQILREHNWPLLPRECSPRKASTERSPRRVPKDSVSIASIAGYQDALSSLLCLSPQPTTHKSDKKKTVKRSDSTETGNKVDSDSELDLNFLLFPATLRSSAVKPSKIAPKRTIPTMRKGTPSKTMKNVKEIEEIDTENKEVTAWRKKTPNTPTTLAREISEIEHKNSHKVLFVPKGREDVDTCVRSLDLSEF